MTLKKSVTHTNSYVESSIMILPWHSIIYILEYYVRSINSWVACSKQSMANYSRSSVGDDYVIPVVVVIIC